MSSQTCRSILRQQKAPDLYHTIQCQIKHLKPLPTGNVAENLEDEAKRVRF